MVESTNKKFANYTRRGLTTWALLMVSIGNALQLLLFVGAVLGSGLSKNSVAANPAFQEILVDVIGRNVTDILLKNDPNTLFKVFHGRASPSNALIAEKAGTKLDILRDLARMFIEQRETGVDLSLEKSTQESDPETRSPGKFEPPSANSEHDSLLELDTSDNIKSKGSVRGILKRKQIAPECSHVEFCQLTVGALLNEDPNHPYCFSSGKSNSKTRFASRFLKHLGPEANLLAKYTIINLVSSIQRSNPKRLAMIVAKTGVDPALVLSFIENGGFACLFSMKSVDEARAKIVKRLDASVQMHQVRNAVASADDIEAGFKMPKDPMSIADEAEGFEEVNSLSEVNEAPGYILYNTGENYQPAEDYSQLYNPVSQKLLPELRQLLPSPGTSTGVAIPSFCPMVRYDENDTVTSKIVVGDDEFDSCHFHRIPPRFL